MAYIFSEHEVCWFCNTKHFLSFLCHVFLAMISYMELVVYFLYDKFAILKENHCGCTRGRICGQEPPFCGFTFNFFWSLLTKMKKFCRQSCFSENWSTILWVEDRTKPPAEKPWQRHLGSNCVQLNDWMQSLFFYLWSPTCCNPFIL